MIPRVAKQQIPIIDDGEWSDRDEAEGDEDELEDDYEDEETDDSSQLPSRKKGKSCSGEAIPGIGEDAPASPETPTPKIPVKQ